MTCDIFRVLYNGMLITRGLKSSQDQRFFPQVLLCLMLAGWSNYINSVINNVVEK